MSSSGRIPIAAMVAQPESIPWRDVILGRKIVIGSLNAELMGEMAAALAAGGIVNQIMRAAMSVPVEQRVFHTLGLDEFRNVAGGPGTTGRLHLTASPVQGGGCGRLPVPEATS